MPFAASFKVFSDCHFWDTANNRHLLGSQLLTIDNQLLLKIACCRCSGWQRVKELDEAPQACHVGAEFRAILRIDFQIIPIEQKPALST